MLYQVEIDRFFYHYPQTGLLLSVYRKSALLTWGLSSYQYTQAVNGWPPDQELLKEGIFQSPTGYRSKWWGDNEIKQIIKRLGLQVIER